VVKLQQHVKVKVVEVDMARKRISLTMKLGS
jgi:ribosomal protein S1